MKLAATLRQVFEPPPKKRRRLTRHSDSVWVVKTNDCLAGGACRYDYAGSREDGSTYAYTDKEAIEMIRFMHPGRRVLMVPKRWTRIAREVGT
jgi:hypothetical protein